MPLAVLLGYFLAEPLEPESLVVVLLVLTTLSVPLMMKWHHPLLVLSWNLALTPFFVPGRPLLWVVMAFASLLIAVLNRSVNPHKQFLYIPSLARPLLFFGAVVVITALLTGGFGLRILGSGRQGGRGYFYLLAALAGFFAFTSERFPPARAKAYVAMFFLPGLTAVISNLAYAAGPKFYFLFDWSPIGTVSEQVTRDFALPSGLARMGGLVMASAALSGYLLARYGVRGVLQLGRPGRLFLFLLAAVGCMASGYRSALILFVLTFAVMFWLEGLHRTRLLPLLAGAGALAGVVVMCQLDKLPFVVQRSLSFLPVPVDPAVRENVEQSNQWRLGMWRDVLPEVPKYLLKGKGYSLDPDELFISQLAGPQQPGGSSVTAALAGDYHNGALSVLMPFGLFGAIGFGWFLLAGWRYLYHNYRLGLPQLHRVNTFLLAAYVAKAAFFFLIFGALYLDFYTFAGLLGFSVSLNGWPAARSEAEASAAPALATFSRL